MGIKPLTDNGDGSYSVEFNAEPAGWGAAQTDMCFTVYAQKTKDALLSDKWWDGTAFRFGGFDVKVGENTTCKSDGDNITLKNIEAGATYIATFTSDASSVYMTVTKK